MKLSYKVPYGVCVVYAIVNLDNGKKYIGSTTRYRLRYREHRLMLKRGEHHAQHLQRSYDKHGQHSFIMVPLEVFSAVDKQGLLDKEQSWIGRHELCNLYNSNHKADQSFRATPKPVFAVTADGRQQLRFNSVFDAGRIVWPMYYRGHNLIRKAVYRQQLSKGYYWTYDGNDTPQTILARKQAVKARKDAAKPMRIFAFDLSGKLVASYPTVAIAARDSQISYSAISTAIKSSRFRTAGGLTWNTIPISKEVKPRLRKHVMQFRGDELVNTWGSSREAARQINGVTHKGICEAANGRSKTHGGYRWVFVKTC